MTPATTAAVPLPAPRSALAAAVRAAPLLARLTDAERAEVSEWAAVCRALDAAPDKGAALARLQEEHPSLRGASRSRVYARLAAWKAEGVEGLVPRRSRSRPVLGRGTRLPAEFCAFWQGLCGLHQRRKAEAARRELFRILARGDVIPGYGADWRGIWAAEHPGMEPPEPCPYSVTGQHPDGWSARNLAALKPDRDVWLGAAQGAAAMRALLPSVPHTRVGLEFGSVFFVDDVWHDFKVMVGQREPQRPLELGMMEALTGRYATWGLCAVVRGEDGARRMLRGAYMRYLLVDLLCRVGVSPRGVTIFAEHGTANVGKELLAAVNAEIERLGHGPDFVRVALGSTYGAPVADGLFQERPRGNPRWKAMLESSWNLLHNETAMIEGQTGRNRDEAPADLHGREKEAGALQPLAEALLSGDPVLAERIVTGFMSYRAAAQYLLRVKGWIESRTDHHLEGWRECGFVRHVADVAGSDVDLDEAARRQPGRIAAIRALVEATGARVREERLSPLAAWHKCAASAPLLRFPASMEAVILGGDPECRSDAVVSERGTIEARVPDGSGRRLVFNAMVAAEGGAPRALPRGMRVRAILNPFNPSRLLVMDAEGRYLGATGRPYEPAAYGDREADRRNLGLWQEMAAEQRRRLAPVIAAQRERRRLGVERSAAALLEAGAGGAPAPLPPGVAPAALDELGPDPAGDPEAPADFGREADKLAALDLLEDISAR